MKLFKHIKDSEVGQIPSDWGIGKVKDYFTLGRGRVISKPYIRENSGSFPVFSSQSFNNGEMGRIDTYDFDGSYLTWTTDGAYAGSVFFREGKFNCTNVCGTCLAKDPSVVNTKYAAYYLETQAKKYVSYVGNPKLMNNIFAEIPIVLPPLPEQNKIAEILSVIDHAISATSKKQKKIYLVLSQLLTDSTTHRTSSNWRETTIGKIVDFQGGSQPPRSTFKFAPEEGYIRMLQIRDYKSDSRATYIPVNLCRRFCDKKDVMIGRYGPPNFQILRGKEGSYNVALIKATPKNENELKKEYLFRFLQRQDLFLLMDTLSQRTSGQQGLDMDALKEFPISLPDPSTQEYICKSLAAIESISLGLQHYEQSLIHLKRAISDQLLSGRKRVKI